MEKEHLICATFFSLIKPQTEIALYIAVMDNMHISVHNLRRHLARLQLYWLLCLVSS